MGAPFTVTLDGPAGVGKTTLAKSVAEALGIAYLDTGAMFRTLALRLGEGAETRSAEELLERAGEISFSLKGIGASTALYCGDTAVGQEIRTEKVGAMASKLAAVPVAREILKAAQRSIGAETSLVAEGRDMGTVIFPGTRYKFFLDASPLVRAKRRLGDLKAMGQEISLEELEKQIIERDTRDRTRAVAPLRPADDACVVDTSDLNLEQVLDAILTRVRQVKEGEEVRAGEYLEAVRGRTPLVHFITNIVTVNDCANMAICAGGAPIMADAPEEVERVTGICDALVLNMGTINRNSALSMRIAGMAAKAAGHPVVLDPVGAGISDLRNDTARIILRDVRPTVIKGNSSEVRFLAGFAGTARGVDAAAGDLTGENNLLQQARLASELAGQTGGVVVISGAIDVVADASSAYAVSNGSAWMGRVSGTGCMGAGVLAAYVAANPGKTLEACVAGMVAMGVAGEKAAARLKENEGAGSYRVYLLDAMSLLDARTMDDMARVRKLF